MKTNIVRQKDVLNAIKEFHDRNGFLPFLCLVNSGLKEKGLFGQVPEHIEIQYSDDVPLDELVISGSRTIPQKP